MSMDRCEKCSKAVDTDFDLEFYVDETTSLCESCRDERGMCDVCDERIWTRHGTVYGIETYYCGVCAEREP